MKKLTFLLAAGLLLGAITTQAQGSYGYDRDVRRDRVDIRHDRQDIRRDRRDLNRDRRDLRFDRHDRCY